MSKTKRSRRIGLSTQPWRKADMAYLHTEAAKLGIELEFKVEGDRLRPRVRTVYVWATSTEVAAAFIQKHFSFPTPYRARVVVKSLPPPVAPPQEKAPEPTVFEEQCSFCGKRKSDVTGLVSGPCVYICNECVSLCNGVLGMDEEERLGIDPKTLVAIVRFARQLPAEVTDEQAVQAIDAMVDAKLAELELWDRARGRKRASVSDLLMTAMSGIGVTAYLAGTRPGSGWPTSANEKTSPTSVDGTASSTAGGK